MVDFKKFYSIFVDEAMERLAELEGGLLGLEESPQDKELINTIFRAVHTIKGSSGSLGLKDISTFTHDMEEVLDLVRQERIVPEKELINIFLEAADRIKEMVQSVAAGTVYEFSQCTELMRRMKDLKMKAEMVGSSGSTIIKNGQPEGNSAPSKAGSGIFRILFVPARDLFRRGLNPSMFLDDLREIGEIIGVKANTEAVPRLSEIDIESLYLKWDILLKTDSDEGTIRKIFEFAEEGSEVTILPVATPEQEMPFIGQILLDEGKIKPEDIEDALKSQKKLGEILVEKGKVNKEDIERALEKQAGKKSDLFRNSVTSTIRVDLKKLDHLLNTVGEMIIVHSMLQQTLKSGHTLSATGEGFRGDTDGTEVVLSQLQRIGKEIQESAMSLRMLPVGEVFQRFARLVRELSTAQGKNIDLIITGEETELDKGMLEKITDPLVHIIRNSIDHGIETPEERVSKGKPEKGMIHLSAYQMGDSVYVEVEDDGKGLNKERIVQKALSTGVIKSDDGLTDNQICGLIFLPGFSTAERVTDISGRGVGMDVVKRNIESLNGRVSVRSTDGEGAAITIKLPLTLAIIDGLAVSVGDEVFIIPLSSVVESLRPARSDIRTIEEKGEVVSVRGEYIRLIRLHEFLDITPQRRDPWEAIVVVTVCDGKKYCFLVDDLLGQQQIVIKHLGTAVPKVGDIAGGTILGNGKVALVLDVPGIVQMAADRC